MRPPNEDWLLDETRKRHQEKTVSLFRHKGKRPSFYKKSCMSSKSIAAIIPLAQDSKIYGHFAFAKTPSRFANLQCRRKTRDVRNYVQGCPRGQQAKDSIQRGFKKPFSLEVSEKRWDSLATDFVVKLP